MSIGASENFKAHLEASRNLEKMQILIQSGMGPKSPNKLVGDTDTAGTLTSLGVAKLYSSGSQT